MVDKLATKPRMAFMEKIRTSVLPRALHLAGALGAVGVPTSVSAPAASTNFGEPVEQVDSHHHHHHAHTNDSLMAQDSIIKPIEVNRPFVLDTEAVLSSLYDGIYTDRNGTTVITYSFDINNKKVEAISDTLTRNERDLQPISEADKAIFLDRFAQLENTINIRFEEAKTPNEAYLAPVAGDLSKVKHSESGAVGIGGYAWLPRREGCVLVLDSELVKNRANAEVTITHELGHALGLAHPHYRAGKKYVLSKEYDNYNTTVMSYRNSNIGSVGGAIADYKGLEKVPKGFQLFDLKILEQKYGRSKKLDKHITHEIGNEKQVKTLVGGLETTNLKINNNAAPTFVDMRSGAENITSTGQSYYWSNAPISNVEALNNEDNVYLGNEFDNNVSDGSGSSIFLPSTGKDTLRTGAGNDIIQIRGEPNFKGHVVIMDYDPAKDLIEYSNKYIERVRVIPYQNGTAMLFQDINHALVSAVVLPCTKPRELGQVDCITDSEITKPLHNGFTKVEYGNDAYHHLAMEGGRIFALQDSVDLKEVRLSYDRGRDNVKWEFKFEDETLNNSITIHDAPNISSCHYVKLDENYTSAGQYEGAVHCDTPIPQKDGSIIYSDKQGHLIKDLRYAAKGEAISPHENYTVIAPNDASYRFALSDNNYIHRGEMPQKIGLYASANTAVNLLNSKIDTLYMLGGEKVEYVDCGNGKGALIAYQGDTLLSESLYVNKLKGDIADLKLVDIFNAKELPITPTKLDKLSPEIRKEVEDGLAQMQERISDTEQAMKKNQWKLKALQPPAARARE